MNERRRLEIVLAGVLPVEAIEHWWNTCTPLFGCTPTELLTQGRVEDLVEIVNLTITLAYQWPSEEYQRMNSHDEMSIFILERAQSVSPTKTRIDPSYENIQHSDLSRDPDLNR